MNLPKNKLIYETPIAIYCFDEKLCLLSDVSNYPIPINQEARRFVTNEMPKYIKENAVISITQMENTQALTILKLSFADFHIQLFSNEYEAKEWLKTYL